MTLYNQLFYYNLIPKCTHRPKKKNPTNVWLEFVEVDIIISAEEVSHDHSEYSRRTRGS